MPEASDHRRGDVVARFFRKTATASIAASFASAMAATYDGQGLGGAAGPISKIAERARQASKYETNQVLPILFG